MSCVRGVVGRGSRPLVVVVGATGVGKTKLAVQLGEKFKGEVVSADSMQLYNALPISTNKATPEEMGQVPHHMIGVLPSTTFGWTVAKYRNMVLPILEDIWDRGKLPIIAGGTMYYMESVLWDSLLAVDETQESSIKALPPELVGASAPVLYEYLKKVDPEQAAITNPTGRRRLLRALQVFHMYGKSWYKVLEERQRSLPGGSCFGGPLRFPNTCIMWLRSELNVLEERLHRRVDAMLELGLEEELTEYYDTHSKEYFDTLKVWVEELGGCDREDQMDKGVFQSIAMKEFRSYLQLSPEQRKEPKGLALFAEGVKTMKIVTRQYAVRQQKWMRNRFLTKTNRQTPPIFILDSTEPQNWDSAVRTPAFSVVESLLTGSPYTVESITPEDKGFDLSLLNKVYFCEDCHRYITGQPQYESHLKSRGHKHFQSKRRQEQMGTLQKYLKLHQQRLQTAESTPERSSKDETEQQQEEEQQEQQQQQQQQQQDDAEKRDYQGKTQVDKLCATG